MKKTMMMAAAALLVGVIEASAQVTSSTRIRVQKEPMVDSAAGTLALPPADTLATLTTDTLVTEWYVPTGTVCSTVDVAASNAVQIKTDLYDPATMISPDSAKIVALCAVPGQIGSGEMNLANGMTEYAIDIIPNHKKTHTKVIVDAQTGAVLSSKQFGGLRGLAGWVRESKEHKQNTKP